MFTTQASTRRTEAPAGPADSTSSSSISTRQRIERQLRRQRGGVSQRATVGDDSSSAKQLRLQRTSGPVQQVWYPEHEDYDSPALVPSLSHEDTGSGTQPKVDDDSPRAAGSFVDLRRSAEFTSTADTANDDELTTPSTESSVHGYDPYEKNHQDYYETQLTLKNSQLQQLQYKLETLEKEYLNHQQKTDLEIQELKRQKDQQSRLVDSLHQKVLVQKESLQNFNRKDEIEEMDTLERISSQKQELRALQESLSKKDALLERVQDECEATLRAREEQHQRITQSMEIQHRNHLKQLQDEIEDFRIEKEKHLKETIRSKETLASAQKVEDTLREKEKELLASKTENKAVCSQLELKSQQIHKLQEEHYALKSEHEKLSRQAQVDLDQFCQVQSQLQQVQKELEQKNMRLENLEASLEQSSSEAEDSKQLIKRLEAKIQDYESDVDSLTKEVQSQRKLLELTEENLLEQSSQREALILTHNDLQQNFNTTSKDLKSCSEKLACHVKEVEIMREERMEQEKILEKKCDEIILLKSQLNIGNEDLKSNVLKVADLSKQLEESKDIVRRKDEEIQGLRVRGESEIEGVKKSAAALQAELRDAENQVRILGADLKLAKEALGVALLRSEKAEAQLLEVNKELQQNQSDLASVRQRMSDNLNEIAGTRLLLKQKEGEIRILQSDTNDLRKKSKTQEEEISALNAALESKEQSILKSREELARSNLVLSEKSLSLRKLEKDIESKDVMYHSSKQDLEQALASVASENTRLKQLLEEKVSDGERLGNQCSVLQGILDSREKQIKNLEKNERQIIESKKGKEEHIKSLQIYCDELNASVEEKSAIIQTLQLEAANLHQELESQRDRHDTELLSMKALIENQTSEIAVSRKAAKNAEDERNLHFASKESLGRKLDGVLKELYARTRELESAKNDIATLSKSLTTTEKEYSAIKDSNTALVRERDQLKDERDSLVATINDERRKEEISTMEIELSKKNHQICEMQEKLKEMHDRIQFQDEELLNKEIFIKDQARANSEHIKKAAALEFEIAHLEDQQAQLMKALSMKDLKRKELEEILSENHETISSLRDSLSKKDIEISRSHLKCENLTKLYEDVILEKEQLSGCNTKMENALKEMKLLQDRSAIEQERSAELSAKLSTCKDELAAVAEMILVKDSQISDLQKSVSSTKTELSEKNTAYNDISHKLISQVDFLDKKTRLVEELQSSLDELACRTKDYESKFQNQESYISSLEDDARRNNEQIQSLQDTLQKSRDTVMDLRMQLRLVQDESRNRVVADENFEELEKQYQQKLSLLEDTHEQAVNDLVTATEDLRRSRSEIEKIQVEASQREDSLRHEMLQYIQQAEEQQDLLHQQEMDYEQLEGIVREQEDQMNRQLASINQLSNELEKTQKELLLLGSQNTELQNELDRVRSDLDFCRREAMADTKTLKSSLATAITPVPMENKGNVDWKALKSADLDVAFFDVK